MKTLLQFIIISLFIGVNSVYAQYPIPSYNIQVNTYATFKEKCSSTHNNPQTRTKRKLNVKIQCRALLLSNCSATVWVYSLDSLDILGPFHVTDAENLVVDIDDRAWGVLVVAQQPVIVNVWIQAELSLFIPSRKMDLLQWVDKFWEEEELLTFTALPGLTERNGLISHLNNGHIMLRN